MKRAQLIISAGKEKALLRRHPWVFSGAVKRVVGNPEEDTTRDIVNDEGLVFPTNPNQLEMSFVFKIIERIINFFLGIFGSDLDKNLTESVADAGKWLDEAISNIAGSLN